jgi:arylsulfatase A-like enzyme
LIALLTGYVPIPTAGRTGSVFAFTEVRGDFHRELQRQKYTTAFFTTGDLRFGQRARWLSEIGIAYAEGSAHPAYAGMPRGPFDAASDAALFDRFLSWYDDERAPGPFMATVLTVRTHPPYLASDGTPDEQERFREVDRQLARFVDGLEERNFFADGLLLIVGDHRAMTPVPEEEQVTMAPSAGNRVPLVAIGKGAMARGAIEGPFQQTDLIPSLTYLIGDHACRNTWQGRFVGSPPQPARFVVHADGLRRSELDVVEGAQAHRLLLDGDDTRWVDPPRSRQEAREVLFEVNRERMRRMSEFTASR